MKIELVQASWITTSSASTNWGPPFSAAWPQLNLRLRRPVIFQEFQREFLFKQVPLF
jgi:hypothetical protein